MASSLPSTPQSAPPNFYSQVGNMAAGQSGGAQAAGQQAGSAAGQPGTPPDADQQFLEMVNKLLKVLQQMSDMKPNGQDVSKYMQAMSQTAKDCIKSVYGGGDQTQDASASADMGDSGAAAGAQPPAAGGQPGANAGAPATS